MCDRCVILKLGRKMYEGVVPSQKKKHDVFQLLTRDVSKAREVIESVGGTFDPVSHLVVLPPQQPAYELLRLLIEKTVRVDSWTAHKPTLEEFYLGMTAA
jgi:ABC-2 type transport system ATP-binding protein